MIDNLVFSLNATIPVFLVMLLGYVLYRIKFIDDQFVAQANKFVFVISLPVQLFHDMSSVDMAAMFDGQYVLFCALSVLISIVVIWILSRLFIKNRSVVGEFVQGSYRSSAAMLGAVFLTNIYGNSGMSGLMLISCVPLFNIFAVLVLTLESPQTQQSGNLRTGLSHSLKGIVTNPIIIGIVLGFIVSLMHISFPPIIDKTLGSIASLTAPLALIALGAGFRSDRAKSQVKLTTIATLIKLIVLPAVFLPIAFRLGFTGQKMAALIVMLGSVTTPTSYVMARQMGHEGSLTASICVATTLFSAFTLTFWFFLARSLGWM